MVSCVTILRGKTPNACLTEWPGLSQNEAECRVAIKRNMCPCCQSHNANPSLNVFCRHSNWCSSTFNYFNLKKGTEHLREPHFTCSRKSIFFFHLALGFFFLLWLISLKVRKNRQQKTCNLSCSIAAKRVEWRCCAFYQRHQTCLAANQDVNRFECEW